jgi:transposase
LPPYSPNLNPIEEAFFKIKAFICRHRDFYSATTGAGIMFNMYEVVNIITSDDAAGYFMHAGYF